MSFDNQTGEHEGGTAGEMTAQAIRSDERHLVLAVGGGERIAPISVP